MSRPTGGYIGFNRVPAASAFNSAAVGVWTLREAEANRKAGTWPNTFINPTSVNGLQLWLDASDSATLFDATTGGSLVAADGGVARWEDKSGNARHATQSTSGSRPLRKANAQGGRDGLLFDGLNDSMQMDSSWGQFGSNNFTVFVVFRSGASATSASNGLIVSQDNTSAFGPIFRYWFVGTALTLTTRTDADGFARDTSPSITVSNSTAYASSITRSSGTITLRLGSSSATSTGSTGAINLINPAVQIGRYLDSDGSSGTPFQGHMLEIFSYNSALSNTDRAAAESYLMTKWGIS